MANRARPPFYARPKKPIAGAGLLLQKSMVVCRNLDPNVVLEMGKAAEDNRQRLPRTLSR